MTDLPAAIARAATALAERQKGFALVGGFAVATRTEPRLTRDADLAVAVWSDREAEELLTSMRGAGYRVSTLVEHEPTGRLATARLVHADAPELVTDLLFASCGIEPEVVAGANPLVVLPGPEIPVASVGHLIDERGFDRGRDLAASLTRLRDQGPFGDGW